MKTLESLDALVSWRLIFCLHQRLHLISIQAPHQFPLCFYTMLLTFWSLRTPHPPGIFNCFSWGSLKIFPELHIAGLGKPNHVFFVNIIQIIDASLQQAKGKKKSLVQRIQVRNKIIWSSHNSCLETQRRHCVVGFVVHFLWPKWLPPGTQGCPTVHNIIALPQHQTTLITPDTILD